MSIWAKEEKVCATCKYWSGIREVGSMGDFYKAIEHLGQCNGPKGSYNPRIVKENRTCLYWELYIDIKINSLKNHNKFKQ